MLTKEEKKLIVSYLLGTYDTKDTAHVVTTSEGHSQDGLWIYNQPDDELGLVLNNWYICRTYNGIDSGKFSIAGSSSNQKTEELQKKHKEIEEFLISRFKLLKIEYNP